MEIECTFYLKPFGKKKLGTCTNIYEEDAKWINENDIKVSMEEGIGGAIVYFDYGKRKEDGEPDEHIELSMGRTCQETIKSAVEKLKTKVL